ncbi:hypothetical protein N657DRAFT_291849 [Parathielavia appendiculata]|uniref:Uncharacterized protein n=1 Tax=Parathielavia appendiculata TaxID=2587402 RepID=A0AAN6U6U4_9PEZI|nr:hypothetical protein N657DRAFT_291849 [Parathielavia appendiculata]
MAMIHFNLPTCTHAQLLIHLSIRSLERDEAGPKRRHISRRTRHQHHLTYSSMHLGRRFISGRVTNDMHDEACSLCPPRSWFDFSTKTGKAGRQACLERMDEFQSSIGSHLKTGPVWKKKGRELRGRDMINPGFSCITDISTIPRGNVSRIRNFLGLLTSLLFRGGQTSTSTVVEIQEKKIQKLKIQKLKIQKLKIQKLKIQKLETAGRSRDHIQAAKPVVYGGRHGTNERPRDA